jgi:adenine-specific DNA-methyltransferase
MSKYQNYTRDQLVQLLEEKDKNSEKKYGLFWDEEREREKVVVECEDNLPVLERVGSKEIRTGESGHNLLIEGDNYHALTVLNYTHKEKIDVIYIDPPYNTGNRDFAYNDRYIDREDSFRHSKWLNFMEKRLILAKRLLSEKGVIFISIDDNEQAYLKVLCDAIFGGENFVANIIIQSNPRGSQSSKHLANVHEYLLCYAKASDKLNLIGEDKKDDTVLEYNLVDKKDGEVLRYRLLGLRQRGGAWKREDRPKMFYPIYIDPKTGNCSLEQNDIFTEVTLPKRPTGEEGRWTWSKEKLQKDIKFLIGKKVSRRGEENFWDIFRKDYLLNDDGEVKTSKTKTIWIEKELNYQNGRTVLKNVLNADAFDYPKPVELLKRILKISSQPNSTVLDFMAGTGTTGQAVLELNKEDGGNRQFILCTNNELNGVGSQLAESEKLKTNSENFNPEQFGICQRVTYPRLQKIIQGYNKNGDGEWVDGLGGNLMYFKTAFVQSSNNRDQVKFALLNQCTEMLCVREGAFDLQEENENYKIFISADKKRVMGAYFDFFKLDLEEFASKIAGFEGRKRVYIFSEDKKVDKTLFREIPNCTVEAIPEPILEIYKELIKLSK